MNIDMDAYDIDMMTLYSFTNLGYRHSKDTLIKICIFVNVYCFYTIWKFKSNKFMDTYALKMSLM